jgi:hypothetical protein
MNRIAEIITMAVACSALLGGAAAADGVGNHAVIVRNVSNNQTIHVPVGQIMVVNLSNTYWLPQAIPPKATYHANTFWQDFNSSNSGVVNLIGATRYSAKPGFIEGMMGGSSAQTFLARADGVTSLTADSGSYLECGSGIGCPYFVILNRFKVTVDVGPTTTCIPKPGYACPF